MRPGKRVRLSLQTGASSPNALLASLLPAGILVFGFASCGGSVHVHSATGVSALSLVGAIAAFVGLAGILALLGRARKERASDIVLDVDGAMIEGGTGNSLSWAWTEMQPANTKVLVVRNNYAKDDDGRADGSRVVIEGIPVAESWDEHEPRLRLHRRELPHRAQRPRLGEHHEHRVQRDRRLRHPQLRRLYRKESAVVQQQYL